MMITSQCRKSKKDEFKGVKGHAFQPHAADWVGGREGEREDVVAGEDVRSPGFNP